MSTVIIMSGIPGSGKTTWRAKYYPDAIVCSADDYYNTSEGYKWDPSKMTEAHGQCLRKFVGALQGGKDIVVDNTNVHVADMAPYYALAVAYGWTVTLVVLRCNVLTARRKIHGVPDEALEVKRRQFERMELPSRWFFVDKIYIDTSDYSL